MPELEVHECQVWVHPDEGPLYVRHTNAHYKHGKTLLRNFNGKTIAFSEELLRKRCELVYDPK